MLYPLRDVQVLTQEYTPYTYVNRLCWTVEAKKAGGQLTENTVIKKQKSLALSTDAISAAYCIVCL